MSCRPTSSTSSGNSSSSSSDSYHNSVCSAHWMVVSDASPSLFHHLLFFDVGGI